MADGINLVIVSGNIGADPELRQLAQAGSCVLNIRLATTKRIKSGDDWKDQTEWHSVEAWGKRADALHKILKKGMHLTVQGSLKTRSYEDKDGVKRYKTTIAGDVFTFGRSSSGTQSSDSSDSAPGDSEPEEGGVLPF